jgi:DNA-binding protein YbaB
MNTRFDEQIAELMERYQRQRQELGEMQREIQEISATAVGGQHAVKVTVDAHGEILELSFPSGAYRRAAPAELAALITQTIRAARAEATAATQEVMGRFRGSRGEEGYLDLERGAADWTQMLPEEPPVPRVVREFLGEGGGTDQGWRP